MPLVDSDIEKLVELLNKIDIRVQIRRKTAAEWTSTNEVLLDSEWGYEHDTGKIKIGDGVTEWNALAYWGGGSGVQVQSITTAGTVTPAADDDLVIVSAQAGPLTIANPAGTESDGQGFVLRIRDNGTARTLTWGTAYRPVDGTLPATTTAGQWMYMKAAYNGADDKWDVLRIDWLRSLMSATGDLIVCGAAGSASRLGVGANGSVLMVSSGMPTWSALSGGGLTKWEESSGVTYAWSKLTPLGAGTNIPAVIEPKGFGANQAQATDASRIGGNARGQYATDWQKYRGQADNVATGNYSTISGGQSNTAYGISSVVGGGQSNTAGSATSTVGGGVSNSANGQSSTVGGGSGNLAQSGGACVSGGVSNSATGDRAAILGGDGNSADGHYSWVGGGYKAITRGVYGMHAHASGVFQRNGDSQRGQLVLRRETSANTAAQLTSDGSSPTASNQLRLPAVHGVIGIEFRVVAMDNTSHEYADFIVRGTAVIVSNTVTVSGATSTLVSSSSGATGWTCILEADNTNKTVKLTATSTKASTRWVAVYSGPELQAYY